MTWLSRVWIAVLSVLIIAGPVVRADETIKAKTDSEIRKHRMGVLTIITKPEAKVTVRQLRHEFLFGTAISSGMFQPERNTRDEATARNRARYRSVLIENFNAAVHENALKWYSTERDRIPEYDLNNETVHSNYYRDRLGDRITKDMFNWAEGAKTVYLGY